MDGEEWSEKRGLSDAARRVVGGFRSIRPGFLKNSDKKKVTQGAKKGGAAGVLGGAEKSAVGGLSETVSGLDNVRENESRAGGFYSGTGKSSDSKSGRGGKSKGKGFLKKGTPAAAIISLVVGVGALIGGSQALQPFSLVAQFRETFNSMHTSANTRSNVFFRMQMETGRVKNPIKGKIFGVDKFKITKRQANKLSQQGIEVDDDFEGTGKRVLKFDDGTGEIRIVAADDKTASELSDMNLKKFDTDKVKYNSEAVSFKNLYAENADFFNGYNKGSMTWRGAIANWFGTLTTKFLESNKLTRNLFQDFRNKVNEANDGNTKKVATDMIAKRAEEIEDGGVKMTGVDEEEEDEDGNISKKPVDTEKIDPDQGNTGKTYVSNNDNKPESSKINRSSVKSEADVKAKLESISGTVQKGANIACTVLNTIGAVSLLVTASEALQIINLTTAYFEAIDKTKAGDGSDSPINELGEALNEKKKNKHDELVSTGTAWNDNDQGSNFDSNGVKTLATKSSTSEKSAMESSGITALYSGGKVDVNDPSVKSFNFTSSINSILGGVGVSMKAFETCAIAKIAANVTSAIADAVTIAGCILGLVGATFTFGVTSTACGPFVAKTLQGIALGVAIGVVVSGIISAIVPMVAGMLTRDLITDIGGEDLGNALTSGGNMYLGNTHRYNGGSLSTIGKYKEFAMSQQQVIAENARYERQTKDPFDATSKYTFMGTLMTQLMSFARATSLTKVITSSSSVVSSSLVALTPTASAYDVAKTLPDKIEDYENTCPYLASIGAIGDAYCNPYSVTDMATISKDPSDVVAKLNDPNGDGDEKDSNFQDEETDDGNVKIKGDSDLAKYIIYCDQRESAFGVADQNIVSSLTEWTTVRTGSSGLDAGVNSAIGAVPILGDALDIMSDKTTLDNLGYVSGESCVAGNKVENASAPGWDKAKDYQRFIEDQSLAESIGLIEESAVTAFVREYREDHPLDNSYEGILARYSGLSKDNVVAVLDVVDYVNYIANYNPSERYAFGAPAVEVEKELRFDNENSVAENVWGVLADAISYADVRNRSFAV